MNHPCRHALLTAVLVAGVAAVLAGPAARACRAQGLQLEFKLTDRDVDQAMERLQNYLWMRQRDDGSWADVIGSHYEKKIGGTTALAVLALLESRVRLTDPRMEKALQALMSAQMNDLYCYAVRVMAMSQAYRQAQRKEFAAQIVHDLNWLTINLPATGCWGYEGPSRTGDNSCAQYGLLALWEAEWAGFDANRRVPPGLTVTQEEKQVDVSKLWPVVIRNLAGSWRMIEKQWIDRQRTDKGWTYAAIPTPDVASTMTMTAAGVASLYIVIDEVYAPKMTPGKPPPATKCFDVVDGGMDWLAQRLTPEFVQDGYLAFGVQRIAAASGHKYIGQHDWFRLGVKEIARRATSTQRELGGAYGPDVQAAFYLLFLARGRVPVTFNKLERPGTDWDCAPRDIANLTRYLITELEMPMAWQIVNVERPVGEFLDAPILFINGIKPLNLRKEVIDKMREYVLRGGFIVGESTNNSTELASSFKAMLEQAFPEGKVEGAKYYTWHKAGKDHPIVATLNDREFQQVEPVWVMEDGTRTIAVLLTRDHATAWQHRDVVKKPQCFKMGWNLFLYATAREPLRTRLRPVFAGRTITAKTAKTLGVMHAGEKWLSAAYAVERLSDKLAVNAQIMVDIVETSDPSTLDPRQCPTVWVTGRGPYDPPDAVTQQLRQYVDKGGLVVLHANMGDIEFTQAAKGLARRILPDALPSPITETDPVFTGMVYRERGKPLADPGIRMALREIGVKDIKLTGYRVGKRWAVIVCQHDVFMSMLGTPIFGCKGYTGETAQQVAANIYLYALEQAEAGPGGN